MLTDLSIMAWEPKISLHGPGYDDPFSYGTPPQNAGRLAGGFKNRKTLYCITVATGHLAVYQSYLDAAEHLGCSESMICVMNNRCKMKGYAIASTEERAREIAAMPDIQRTSGAREVWTCDPVTMKTENYPSIAKAYAATHISKKFLSLILDDGRPKLYQPRFENSVKRCVVGASESDVIQFAKDIGESNA